MPTPAYGNAGNTCTTLEERPEHAELPPGTKGYLAEKAETALKLPRVIDVKLKDGGIVQRALLQVVMAGTIRAEEERHDYLWQYKAEVSYDMTPTAVDLPPRPFLSSANPGNPLRRHSLNPFPPGYVPGRLRRPDVTIVTDPALRWPGLATTDHQGVAHPDNVLRIVELKFPGDALNEGQERAYLEIAGNDESRLTVADVRDCDGVLEKVRQPAPRPAPKSAPTAAPVERRERAPVRSVQPIVEPVFYEVWLHEAGQTAEALWAALQAGVAQLSAKAQAWLRREAPWLFAAGRWVRDAAGRSYTWVDEQGRTVLRWTSIQLRNAWQLIAAQTDLTWQQLEHVEWGQLLMDTVKGLCVLALVVGGVVLAVVLAEALLVALLAIVAIVAQMGAAAVAAIGVGVLATAAAR